MGSGDVSFGGDGYSGARPRGPRRLRPGFGLPELGDDLGGEQLQGLRVGVVRAPRDEPAAAGVDVEHHVYAEMPHVWQLSYPAYPEAVDAVTQIGEFVRRVTG